MQGVAWLHTAAAGEISHVKSVLAPIVIMQIVQVSRGHAFEWVLSAYEYRHR